MAGRRPIIAANWKMHKTRLEAIQAVQKLSYLIDQGDTDRVEVVVCPPFTALRSVQTLIDSDRLPYALGAQDVHWEDEGAFTGEVSPPMLRALNVSYVVVGHSERRAMFGDTDETVNAKVRAVLAQPNGEKWPIAGLLHGAGLRRVECLRRRVKDVDFGQRHLVVAGPSPGLRPPTPRRAGRGCESSPGDSATLSPPAGKGPG